MLKNLFPISFCQYVRLNLKKFKIRNKNRIFCLSAQKTGTTSVGDFFEHLGFSTARWHDSNRNSWSKLWFEGNFNAIFTSLEFQSFQVFEDNPWWFPEFYKVLYHRFPDSKFILFTRDSDDWFNSMKRSFHGDSKEALAIHAKIYRREKEFYEILDNHHDSSPIEWQRAFSLEGKELHYKQIYETRNLEIMDFFKNHNPDSFLHCELNDKKKWIQTGNFVGIDIPENFRMHANKTFK